MSWADNLQIRDLDPTDRLEMTCRRCGQLRYIEVAPLQAHRLHAQLYLFEVEHRARCRSRGCNGTMRMALPLPHKTTGFVGGIA